MFDALRILVKPWRIGEQQDEHLVDAHRKDGVEQLTTRMHIAWTYHIYTQRHLLGNGEKANVAILLRQLCSSYIANQVLNLSYSSLSFDFQI